MHALTKHARHLVLFLALLLPVLTIGDTALAQPESAPAETAPPQTRVESDRWYEVWVDDARAGWTRETVVREEGRFVTKSEMRMSMERAGQTIEIRMETVFTETEAGEPIEATIAQWLGPSPVRTTYRFEDDHVLAVTSQNDAEHQVRLDKPEGEWLPPAAARRYIARRLASDAREITVRTLDPSNGPVVTTVTWSGIEPAEIEVVGQPTECVVADTRTQSGPASMKGREWIAPDGASLRNEIEIGGMTMSFVASSRERASAAVTPPEVMMSTFVKPDRPIRNPRRTSRAVYLLSARGGDMPELPDTGAQRVETLEGGGVRVTIDTASPAPDPDAEAGPHLEATSYADAGDERVRELTEEALRGAGDEPRARAEALRRFVLRHIAEKDLGTAFATASEVARSGQGDCSEHAVLLAAMLRAAGIPSRVAVGVVYVEQFAGERNVFGYHMWTQALIDTPEGPTWLDLDATLDERTAFDATHITLATSDLAEGRTISQLAGFAPLLGALEIRVEEAR